jgi:hypothetical protein
MVRFERVLVGPTAEGLERALAEAAAVANEGASSGLLPWPPAEFADDLARAAQQREGHRQWLPVRWPEHHGERTGVALAWWTDRLGRRHHRIVGRRGLFGKRHDRRQAVLTAQGEHEPLALVYPERVFRREREGSVARLALCDCGCFGPPEAVGWMGACCGPCHDRREEGGPPPPGPRTALRAPRVDVWRLDWWGAGGEALASYGSRRNEVMVWRPLTGEAESLAFPDFVTSVASAPSAGLLAVGTIRQVFVLAPGGPRQELAAPGDETARTIALSPDGRWLAAGGVGGLVVWRLADRRVLLEGDRDTEVVGFTPDGQALVTYQPRAGVALRDLKTGQARPLPGVVIRYLSPGLALAPDGRWLAVGHHERCKLRLYRLGTPLAPPLERPDSRRGAQMAFTPDGSVLAYAATEGRVFFWALDEQRELGALRLLGPEPMALAFSPDGRCLAVGTQGGVVLWPWRELLGAEPGSREGR